MDLIPLADRVLIQPDTPASVSAGGLHLIEDWPDEVSGKVVSVGRTRHPRKDEAFELADEIGMWNTVSAKKSDDTLKRAAQLLRDLTGREPEVAVGDRVLFSRASGQEIHIDDTRYFVMREADLIAILEAGE